MPYLSPERFVIKALSRERQTPENESYEVQTQLNNGRWTSSVTFRGVYELRWFLQAAAVDADTIQSAIDELNGKGLAEVKVGYVRKIKSCGA